MTQLKQGLSSAEAKIRLEKYGYNEVTQNKLAGFWEMAKDVLFDPQGVMLLILSVIYFFLGKRIDGTILLIAYVPIVGVDVLLKLQSQKALKALKKNLQPRCHVLRDGKMVEIPTREIVPDDLIVLEEGQTIPADGKLVEASNLTLDEAALTGEAVPIEKQKDAEALSGTVVLTGTGTLLVEKTGRQSQIGEIANVLKEYASVPSPLLRTMRKIVKWMFAGAILLSILVFFLAYFKSNNIPESIISALTLGMAAVPEEFPIVVTIYLSLAAYRLSKKGILVKSLPAVEALGRVDTICTDKTGTLTEGEFRLEHVLNFEGKKIELSEDDARALLFACKPKPVDAMEAAIFNYLDERLHLAEGWNLKYDYEFNQQEKYMSHVWERVDSRLRGNDNAREGGNDNAREGGNDNAREGGNPQILAMKGAIEGVLAHCDSSMNKDAILEYAEHEAEAGRRLLGLAAKTGQFTGNRKEDETNLKFIGILSFTDPVRENTKEAIEVCQKQEIEVKMLTGDHKKTAQSIAKQINLSHADNQIFTGTDLEKLSNEDKTKAYKSGVIFARVKPMQKLELIESLKTENKIIAMTGDGINDAPALKRADIGISMGATATDVARSSAKLVLMRNDFYGIVSAILEGQRTLWSLTESFGYLIAFHIPIISIALYQSFFLENSILLPIHIILMELVIHPVSAFVFDEPLKEVHEKNERKKFITVSKILWSSIRGILLTLLAILTYEFMQGPHIQRAAIAVLALVLGNTGLLIAEKDGFLNAFSKKRFVRTLTATFLLCTFSVILAYVPAVTRIFSLAKPSIFLFVAVALLGMSIGFVSKNIFKIKPA